MSNLNQALKFLEETVDELEKNMSQHQEKLRGLQRDFFEAEMAANGARAQQDKVLIANLSKRLDKTISTVETLLTEEGK